jgi:S-adenosylmethionine uptake transporter
MMSPSLRGALCSVMAFALYSLSDITIKFLGADYSTIQIVFFAGLASFPLIVLQMMAEGKPVVLRPVLPKLTALRALLVVFNSVFVSYGFANLPLSQAYAIFFMMPLFICVLAVPLLGERIDLARGLAVLVGLVGVVVVLRPGVMELHLAHLSALMGASIGAVYYIIIRRTGGVESMAVIMLYPTLAQVAAMALMLPMVYRPMPIEHLGLLGLMAVEGFTGSLFVVWAYRAAPSVVVAPMQYVQIIIATLFGTLYFGEPTDAMTVLGIAIIIAAGLFIMTRPEVVKTT